MFNGEFLAPLQYRGLPSKQLDKAWDKITLGGTRNMRIDMSNLSRLNKTKNDKTEFIYDDGKGGIAVVMLEVFYYLYCLVSTPDSASVLKHDSLNIGVTLKRVAEVDMADLL